MSTIPVLVVHGIANHDRAEFELRVKKLQGAIHTDLPGVQLIPVFWGDLGGRSEDIQDCLPRRSDGRWTTRADGLQSTHASGDNLWVDAGLSNRERASRIAGVPRLQVVRGAPNALTDAIAEALGQTEHLQRIDDPEIIRAVGQIVIEALNDRSAAPQVEAFEVRGESPSFETRGWIKEKVGRVISDVDKMIGRVVEGGLGILNQRLRASLLNGVAVTLGDIVAYHSNKEKIQQRLWDAVNRGAPGYGEKAMPIGLIAHSLGGVISFDAMVAPASGKPLYVDAFVSFGSQPAFFEIMDPHLSGARYRSGHPITLPDTVKRWFNLWEVVDPLAFTAGTVFRLNDGSAPEDISVEDPISVMLDEKLWLHSIYWNSPELMKVLVKAFR